jgi:hypothetical protein
MQTITRKTPRKPVTLASMAKRISRHKMRNALALYSLHCFGTDSIAETAITIRDLCNNELRRGLAS